jgi:hypothetical protein
MFYDKNPEQGRIPRKRKTDLTYKKPNKTARGAELTMDRGFRPKTIRGRIE